MRNPRRTRPHPGFTPTGPLITVQAGADDLETQAIYEKFVVSGSVTAFNALEPRYGDFSGVGDYLSCLSRLQQAQDAFDALPAKVRERFQNDPAELIAAAEDPARHGELRDLGLLLPGEAPPPAGEESPAPPAKPEPAQ